MEGPAEFRVSGAGLLAVKPFQTPKTLSGDAVYAVAAYVLTATGSSPKQR